MKLVYTGPHDAVDVVLPNGASQIVPYGGQGDFPKQVAESLLEQGDEHWVAADDAGNVTVAARTLADEHDIDIAAVAGTGADGRITKADIEAAIAAQPATEEGSE
jgi:pyruvate/2-oxoglutarate dehydrogenase complex dihydrolipoamide acyltransferase (E2) component